MTEWTFSLESVQALESGTQRFIVALYPNGELFERTNIDIEAEKVAGMTSDELVSFLKPRVQEQIDELSPSYEEKKAAAASNQAIADVVAEVKDQHITL